MRVAIYMRISTSRQAEAHTSDQQLERLSAHAHAGSAILVMLHFW